MNPRDDERGARIVAGGNKFAFASVVRQRAEAIAKGSSPRVATISSKPITIAIKEAACDLLAVDVVAEAAPPPIGRYAEKLGANQFRIECRDCGAHVKVQRRPGVPLQGRPPTRCAACGLSPNWEQA